MKSTPYLAAAGLAAIGGGDKAYAVSWPDLGVHALTRSAAPAWRAFAYDHVLGTSLDLVVETARPVDALRAEQAMLVEISRLTRILSTYDPDSEISRIKSDADPRSPELAAVLGAYDRWSRLTGGVINGRMSEVIALWKAAARADRLPEQSDLAAAARVPTAYNVDALGKGFVIERAVKAAREFAPTGLLNIGGDIRVWGERDWTIGIADPADPADNAAPLASVVLREAAVATSGSYARNYRIGGAYYSHLIDPRTLWPAPFGGGATAIAADAVTANAVSTAAAILGTEGARQVSQLPAQSGGLVVNPTGAYLGWGSLENVTPVKPQFAAAAIANAWPQGNQVSITVKLRSFGGVAAGEFGRRGGPGGRGGVKRPYVAVWVEDEKGQVVRNITLWASESKYIPEMSTWWSRIRGNRSIVQTITRATRPAGSYTLTWDGRDDSGKPVAMGAYKVFVEINREHGGHVVQSAVIACERDAATAELKVTSESEASPIAYGPRATATTGI